MAWAPLMEAMASRPTARWAVAPVDALASPPPPAWLHPSVLAAQVRRDPPYFGALVSPEPAGRRPAAEALGSPGSPGSESALPRSPAGLPSGRLSILASVLRT